MNTTELISSINKDLTVALPENISFEEIHNLLSGYINLLIQKDFNKLLTMLYRIDVSEEKLKQMLESSDEEAGKVIAGLIIERQLQKIKSRQEFSQRDNNFSDEELL
jgi:hypothetical protein